MPHLSLLFARRYLFSKKSHSVINVISGVSAVAVAVPVMAMVILLSVFNGFEGLIRDMYKSFDPDILITPSSGKVFDTEKTVISYENLGIGRLIYQLPTTLCEMFLQEVFKYGSRRRGMVVQPRGKRPVRIPRPAIHRSDARGGLPLRNRGSH